jgi:hypothetical protein
MAQNCDPEGSFSLTALNGISLLAVQQQGERSRRPQASSRPSAFAAPWTREQGTLSTAALKQHIAAVSIENTWRGAASTVMHKEAAADQVLNNDTSRAGRSMMQFACRQLVTY